MSSIEPYGAAVPYRVLARKYRPRSFDDLIGQAPMVRTLTNAFETGRIAQAWMLTGVRGVGKTTTARILARALNYETEAIRQPTIRMVEPGLHCQAIMEGRHVDVTEMDAASHTGIDDVREIIAQVRYKPLSARYKVTIIDEVHMLSTQAFNGLLKTLEEPPEHAKFVFATTEIRKVPVTVLSRCQRFDLRRVEAGTLIAHLRAIAAMEGVPAEEDALRLIARAAEGSVRDALSLCDQAIAHGAGAIEAAPVRDMLGLADRARIIDLFEAVMAGDAAGALGLLREQHDAGADPVVVLADLADFTHLVTTLRFVPEAAEDAALSPAEASRGLAFAKSLSIRSLSQVWQMLLKGIEEARAAANPRQAAEMALIRIAYAADRPGPEEMLRRIRSGETDAIPAERPSAGVPQAAAPPADAGAARVGALPSRAEGRVEAPPGAATPAEPPRPRLAMVAPLAGEPRAFAPPSAEAPPAPAAGPAIETVADIARLAEDNRDSFMRMAVRRYLREVSVAPGRLTVALADGAPATLPADLSRKLHDWTGRRWVISLSAGTAPTLDEADATAEAGRAARAAEDPDVAAVLAAFPGARVAAVRARADFGAQATDLDPETLDEAPGGDILAVPDDDEDD